MSRTEIVVARHSEDLAWLDAWRSGVQGVKITVYNKGDPQGFDGFDGFDVHELPNVGRETHTYLTHIVDNYYKLADVTVFLQGKPHDHCESIEKVLTTTVLAATALTATVDGSVSAFSPVSTWRIEINDFYPKHHPSIQNRLGSLYDDLFRTPRPRSFFFHAGAMFAVDKTTILRRPRWFYEHCLALVSSSVDPVEGYCFERLWGLIFDDSYKIRIRLSRLPVSIPKPDASRKLTFNTIVAYTSVVFHETAVGISDALTLLGIPTEIRSLKTTNAVYGSAMWIIVGAHMLETLPPHAVIVQMEQTTSRLITDSYRNKLASAMAIWDFSKANVEHWKSVGIQTPLFVVPLRVPMCFMTQEEESTKTDVDVLFYGCTNPRRERLYHHLNHLLTPKGYKVVFKTDFDTFGDEREKLIARAKIVLNLHFYDNAVLETHRIEYLLAHGKCVVSEPSADAELDDVYRDSVVFARYEGLAETTLRLLGHPEKIKAAEVAGWNSVWNRQCDLKPVRTAVTSALDAIRRRLEA